jgi:1-deoxy-D-xylulose-5-phosphate synthase
VAHDDGPIAFRYPRGNGTGVAMPERGEVLQIGKGRVLTEGTELAILSYGNLLPQALDAATALEAEGLSVTVADARFVKPLDLELLEQLARHHRGLITLEAGAEGGFGSVVLHALARGGMLDGGLAVRPMTLPDRYIHQASPEQMYEEAGLTVSGICATAREMTGRAADHPQVVRFPGA